MAKYKFTSSREHSLTLIELMISLSAITVVIGMVFSAYYFFLGNIRTNVELGAIHAQINYAIEMIQLVSGGAVGFNHTKFFSVEEGAEVYEIYELRFRGQHDFTNITPFDNSDDLIYDFKIGEAGKVKDALVLKRITLDEKVLYDEILVESKFSPKVRFNYTAGDEPSFITVTITGTTSTGKTVERTDGIRFWYITIVR